MRANAIKREPELQQFWAEHQIYEKLAEHNPGAPFILHDGPPYANGAIHMGHTLNKVLKDILNKYQMLQGRKVRYVPGWDCHGLPIELKVLQAMKPEERQALTPLELRRRAKSWALEQMAQQRDSFKKLGIWGDWDHPYLTMQPEYEAAQIRVFGQMALKGYIYRGLSGFISNLGRTASAGGRENCFSAATSGGAGPHLAVWDSSACDCAGNHSRGLGSSRATN
ncbi:class I tRNA ligase family protein [Leptolyngbya sp. 7M]|nr:class I tRNA ligase family protein [Leptolyngbya sp. 7M]